MNSLPLTQTVINALVNLMDAALRAKGTEVLGNVDLIRNEINKAQTQDISKDNG